MGEGDSDFNDEKVAVWSLVKQTTSHRSWPGSISNATAEVATASVPANDGNRFWKTTTS